MILCRYAPAIVLLALAVIASFGCALHPVWLAVLAVSVALHIWGEQQTYERKR